MSALFKKCLKRLKQLPADTSGMALTEFAFTAPILLSLGLLGTETARFVVAHMNLSQVATQVADNASRVGESNVLVERRVFESHLNDMFIGADQLAGDLDIFEHGRVIVSSLEVNADGGQWIHWQRCRGLRNVTSSFGEEGDGATGTGFPGMGEAGQEITATPGNAVMFVEVQYEYQPMTVFSDMAGRTISYTAAFNVRDVRDLTQVYNTTPAEPVADCDNFTN
jgi:hypothetical protein